VFTLFLRRSHDSDLKPMTALDDGKPQLGAEPVDDAARPPIVKPPMAAAAAPSAVAPQAAGGVPESAPPAPSPFPAPPAAPSPLDAAVTFVKNFPLDGGRGTVSKWLDFSYLASPDAGQELWNATQQSDNTYLVEYRFVPSVKGAPEIQYLFEADPERGYVLGKNRDARDLLAGGGPAGASTAPAPKKKAHKPRRRAPAPASASTGDDDVPRAVPQLPLPTDGQLHAPAADDGDFGSDTVKPEP
jgi:hypothetical protein